MNLNSKTDSQIETDLKQLRQNEKNLLAELLHHLLQVEVRSIDLARGYASINQYCERELGCSSDEAFYRVQAMRLIKSVPEAEATLRDGSMSLTALARTRTSPKTANASDVSNESGAQDPCVSYSEPGVAPRPKSTARIEPTQTEPNPRPYKSVALRREVLGSAETRCETKHAIA